MYEILAYIDNIDSYKRIIAKIKEEKVNNITLLTNFSVDKKGKNIKIIELLNSNIATLINKGLSSLKKDLVFIKNGIDFEFKYLEKFVVNSKYNNCSVMIPSSKPELNKNTHIEDESLLLINSKEEEIKCSEVSPILNSNLFFIKKDVLDRVGLFNEFALSPFIDYSIRISELGENIIICEDLYINELHNECDLLSDNNFYNRVFFNKTKEWDEKEKNPIYLDIAKRNICRVYNKIKKNVFVLIHDFFDIENNRGGTSLHVYDLIKRMKSDYNFYILSPENNGYTLYFYLGNNHFNVFYDMKEYYVTNKLYNREYFNLLNDLIEYLNIDIIHIHHLKEHYFDISKVIKERNIDTVLSLHDCYSACPIFTKMYCHEEYCGDKDYSCNTCLNKIFGYNANVIDTYQEAWKKVFEVSKHIIVPSNNTREEISKTYKNLKMEVIEHGIDLNHYTSNLKLDDNIVDIAFVGAMAPHKGSRVIEDLILNSSNEKYRLHLFGTNEFSRQTKKVKNYIDHGPYKREELYSKLTENNIKLICLFSICPETYSYTLSESIACGIPVLIFDIGAGSERVKQYKLGWNIDYRSDVNTIKDAIYKIINNPKEYNNIIKSINKYTIKTTDMMAEDYKKLYKSLKIQSKNNNHYDKIIYNYSDSTYKVTLDDVNFIKSKRAKFIRNIRVPKIISKILKRGR